jgi:predicted TPR repeat methyltransferase
LRPGGLLVFSTEAFQGEGFRLQTSGRFAHAAGYVRQTAGAAFEERSRVDTTIRTEGVRHVAGELFVFRRRNDARPASLKPLAYRAP